MTEDMIEKKEEKRTRGPNKIDVLEAEVKQLKKLILGLANYTGQDTLMKKLGVAPEDLYVPGKKEINRR